MITLKEKQAKERAKKNIENFLRELDAQIPGDSDEIYLEGFYSNISQRTWLARTLNEYDERKYQIKQKLKMFSEQIELEQKNGFGYLTSLKKREINVIRRFEAEQLVDGARLGPEDSKELLIPVVCRIYRRGGFGIPKRYQHHHSQK